MLKNKNIRKRIGGKQIQRNVFLMDCLHVRFGFHGYMFLVIVSCIYISSKQQSNLHFDQKAKIGWILLHIREVVA